MNIVFLEGCLSNAKNTERLKKALQVLTDNQEPNILYFEIKLLSEIHYRKLKNNS